MGSMYIAESIIVMTGPTTHYHSGSPHHGTCIIHPSGPKVFLRTWRLATAPGNGE